MYFFIPLGATVPQEEDVYFLLLLDKNATLNLLFDSVETCKGWMEGIKFLMSSKREQHANKEERESKEAKTFLGNVNVVWSNGQNVEAKIKANGAGPQTKAEEPEDDLPF